MLACEWRCKNILSMITTWFPLFQTHQFFPSLLLHDFVFQLQLSPYPPTHIHQATQWCVTCLYYISRSQDANRWAYLLSLTIFDSWPPIISSRLGQFQMAKLSGSSIYNCLLRPCCWWIQSDDERHNQTIESAGAGASLTYPMQCASLPLNSLAFPMLIGHPVLRQCPSQEVS